MVALPGSRRQFRAVVIAGTLLATPLFGAPLFSATEARAQDINTTVELGVPATLRLDLSYRDPVDLFPRLDGTLIFPLWVSARNISTQPATLAIRDLRLTLGAPGGATASLTPMDPRQAEQQLRNDVRMSAALGAIARQGGVWARNPYTRFLSDGRLDPGASRGGYVFFERPAGFVFDGFMTLGTTAHKPELLATGTIRTAPTTRSDTPSLPDRVLAAISNLPIVRSLEKLIYGRPFDKSYALLFGISTYDDASRNLIGPARDLAKMQAYLQRQGFDDVVTLSDRQVDESALRNLLAHFNGKIGVNDRLLIYYAGHGQRNDAGDAYLLLSKGTRVPMAKFMSWVRGVKVKHLLVLLDACYSGSVIGGTARDAFASLDRATQQQFYLLASQGSRFVITAGTATEVANEDPRWDGGLFTAGFLQALNSKPAKQRGLITTHELYGGLKKFVLDEVVRNQLTAQTPLLQDLGYDGDGKNPPQVSRGEFVFVSGR